MIQIVQTLVASVESVTDAAILALPGFFLCQKGFMTKEGKKLLAQISQHVTFPLLLFTSILYCQQDGGTYRGAESKCPNVLKTITASWIVLLWPFYVVAWGIIVGKLMSKVSNAPSNFQYASMAAVAFGNSTGLPLTLVSIIHNAAASGSALAQTDPAIYVSIYLIFNPILQWSVGAWLLEPHSDDNISDKKQLENKNKNKNEEDEEGAKQLIQSTTASPFHLSSSNDKNPEILNVHDQNNAEIMNDKEGGYSFKSITAILYKQLAQPAIIASVCGLIIACIKPLHGALVDVKDQDGDAPLEFIFDAMYTIGKAAIPINMMMLGATLTQGVQNVPANFRWGPNLAVAFGKLMVMPLIATITVLLFHAVFPVKSTNAASLYFAMLIMTCTPTANSVNVMAEIGGVNKETIGLCIMTQYAFAPISITFWVTVFQYLVRGW